MFKKSARFFPLFCGVAYLLQLAVAAEPSESGALASQIPKYSVLFVKDPVEDYYARTGDYPRFNREPGDMWKVVCTLGSDNCEVVLLTRAGFSERGGNSWHVYVRTDGGYYLLGAGIDAMETMTFRDDAAWLGHYKGFKGNVILGYAPCCATYGALTAYEIVDGKIRETIVDRHFVTQEEEGEESKAWADLSVRMSPVKPEIIPVSELKTRYDKDPKK